MNLKYHFTLFLLTGFFITQAQSPLVLGGYNKKVKAGETTCVGIYGRSFDRILSMQYTLQWDNELLKFKRVDNMNLPGMSINNFGLNRTNEGLLTFAWYDPQLIGITKSSGEQLYEVCFEASVTDAATTYLQFTSEPTVIEISMGSGVLIDLRTEGGKIEIHQ